MVAIGKVCGFRSFSAATVCVCRCCLLCFKCYHFRTFVFSVSISVDMPSSRLVSIGRILERRFQKLNQPCHVRSMLSFLFSCFVVAMTFVYCRRCMYFTCVKCRSFVLLPSLCVLYLRVVKPFYPWLCYCYSWISSRRLWLEVKLMFYLTSSFMVGNHKLLSSPRIASVLRVISSLFFMCVAMLMSEVPV